MSNSPINTMHLSLSTTGISTPSSQAELQAQQDDIGTSVIKCSRLTKTFDDGGLYVEVLRGIDLTVKNNEMLAIMGASGSGKSTLLHLLASDKSSDGKIWVSGIEITHYPKPNAGKLEIVI